MHDPTWAQTIPGYAFDMVGSGRMYLLEKSHPATGVLGVPTVGRVSKFHGVLDVDFTLTTLGVARTIVSLTDSDAPTAISEVGINVANRILASVTDELGTVRAGVTSSLILAAGRHQARIVYNALSPIAGTRHAVLLIDGVLDPAPTWTVDPIAPWAPFTPTWLMAGFRPGAVAFGDEIHRTQVGNESVF